VNLRLPVPVHNQLRDMSAAWDEPMSKIVARLVIAHALAHADELARYRKEAGAR
jgi:hypothetical protein